MTRIFVSKTKIRLLASAFCLALSWAPALYAQTAAQTAPAAAKPRNVIIFVADGLRYGIVNHDTAPTFANIQTNGVDFRNSHAMYPTVTTVNASAIATGHGIGDTGEWANSLKLPSLPVAPNQTVHGMEDDLVLKQTNAAFGGNYLDEMSLLHLARDNGYQTAAIGKEGPILIQDIDAADGKSTLIFDDSTGRKDRAVPLPADVIAAMQAADIAVQAPGRGTNGDTGSDTTPGTQMANIEQQPWFVDVATKVVLPRFAATGQPFALVYWSRDPDGTQHNQGDSLNSFSPGINGKTSLAAVRNASDNLQALIDELKTLGIYDNTDIFVTADHGFSTISRQSKTSYAASLAYPNDTVKGFLPDGFMAIDLAHALNLPLADNNGLPINYTQGFHPKGMARLGPDAQAPEATVVESGGSDLIYLDPKTARTLAPRIVKFLTTQDYVAAIFVDDGLGTIPGALPMSAVGLEGSARTERPAIYVSFADFALPSCVKKWHDPEICSVMVSDTNLQQGQGNHGGLTRANTRNFMAATGPDFKTGFIDNSPVSNADITPTLAHILGFSLPSKGVLKGRVINEALTGGPDATPATAHVTRSPTTPGGFVTVLESQTIGDETYLDAAGMPGRVVGLKTTK
ncbi:alkaline phosphatase family protein [Asticcacaulis sp. EMRT-3]|uniref:alkaline phosphatase family protein n=1 Tax=Asticcacaulis sp. EMRT-3 TaxID=3040349 RepID=UPI0024AF0D40|nr:alkaline phosphatase family protein [Asticcacaulis sp. EMRT-3]MDI7775185.1 alkaline phosphatase family protein [Asticcacaulis sp. EMRT-3]